VWQPRRGVRILGRDGDALADFYGDLFGWQLDQGQLPGWPRYALLRAETGIGERSVLPTLSMAPPSSPTSRATTPLQRALQFGATVVLPTTPISEAQVAGAWLKDPQGNIIRVVKNHENDATSRRLTIGIRD